MVYYFYYDLYFAQFILYYIIIIIFHSKSTLFVMGLSSRSLRGLRPCPSIVLGGASTWAGPKPFYSAWSGLDPALQ